MSDWIRPQSKSESKPAKLPLSFSLSKHPTRPTTRSVGPENIWYHRSDNLTSKTNKLTKENIFGLLYTFMKVIMMNNEYFSLCFAFETFAKAFREFDDPAIQNS